MIAQEAGSDPGKGLKVWQTLTLYVGTPLALFILIAGTVFIATSKNSTKKSDHL